MTCCFGESECVLLVSGRDMSRALIKTYGRLIKTHGRVSAAKKDARAQVCYLRDRSSSRFQPLITQKMLCLFPPNL